VLPEPDASGAPDHPLGGSSDDDSVDVPVYDAPSPDGQRYIDDHTRRRVTAYRGRHPLLEWVVYVGIMAVIGGVIAGPVIGPAIGGDLAGSATAWILLVLLGVFLAALIKNLLDMRFLSRQIRLADHQIQQLSQTNNIYVFLRESEPSLLRDHIDNLHEIFRRDVNISQDNLVALLQTRLSTRTRIVDFASSALVTLGLVGTIIGLIQSAGGLGVVFSAVGGDNTDLLAGMRQTIRGMGVAFYTTLMGALLGGVFLRLLSNLVEGHTDHIVSHIAELTEIYILPILRRAARINEERARDQRAEARRREEPAPPAPASEPASATSSPAPQSSAR
jgi:biopolymer transport protein ExbB/TolQ